MSTFQNLNAKPLQRFTSKKFNPTSSPYLSTVNSWGVATPPPYFSTPGCDQVCWFLRCILLTTLEVFTLSSLNCSCQAQ